MKQRSRRRGVSVASGKLLATRDSDPKGRRQLLANRKSSAPRAPPKPRFKKNPELQINTIEEQKRDEFMETYMKRLEPKSFRRFPKFIRDQLRNEMLETIFEEETEDVDAFARSFGISQDLVAAMSIRDVQTPATPTGAVVAMKEELQEWGEASIGMRPQVFDSHFDDFSRKITVFKDDVHIGMYEELSRMLDQACITYYLHLAQHVCLDEDLNYPETFDMISGFAVKYKKRLKSDQNALLRDARVGLRRRDVLVKEVEILKREVESWLRGEHNTHFGHIRKQMTSLEQLVSRYKWMSHHSDEVNDLALRIELAEDEFLLAQEARRREELQGHHLWVKEQITIWDDMCTRKTAIKKLDEHRIALDKDIRSRLEEVDELECKVGSLDDNKDEECSTSNLMELLLQKLDDDYLQILEQLDRELDEKYKRIIHWKYKKLDNFQHELRSESWDSVEECLRDCDTYLDQSMDLLDECNAYIRAGIYFTVHPNDIEMYVDDIRESRQEYRASFEQTFSGKLEMLSESIEALLKKGDKVDQDVLDELRRDCDELGVILDSLYWMDGELEQPLVGLRGQLFQTEQLDGVRSIPMYTYYCFEWSPRQTQ